mmetsp:Transcript_20128/g.50349  ORF Transcript_20128/g.50349 Transcript_20128/m.50349 type:complete len:82 (-) Transcript_20128:2018-2263(-)
MIQSPAVSLHPRRQLFPQQPTQSKQVHPLAKTPEKSLASGSQSSGSGSKGAENRFSTASEEARFWTYMCIVSNFAAHIRSL